MVCSDNTFHNGVSDLVLDLNVADHGASKYSSMFYLASYVASELTT
jgi:hypothetical protein